MNYNIEYLRREQWKGYPLPIGYRTEAYYNVVVEETNDGFSMNMKKMKFDSPVIHTPEENNYPDKLYEEHWEGAFAWGVRIDGKLVAAIETCPEEWSNRLRITELWVDETYQKKGIGQALMNIAKKQAIRERRRAIILETQSCNVNAIGFYLHEGFTLIGFDSCCYANNDLDRKEVRIELGWIRETKQKVSTEQVLIRKEEEADWFETELMIKRAFWNKYRIGCMEHYFVHKLRMDKAYVPEISRIAVVDGKIVGAIMYSKATVVSAEDRHEILTFGPLAVDPEYQGRGVGAYLLRETMQLAAEAGYKGIVILGEPDYYPRHGFKTCDHFGIT
ncbi:MAG: GNAT family N-acetyltransferase, partial [Lachnospiraceae bacterium]